METNIWALLIAGGVGAGITKIIERIIAHWLDRSAKSKDKRVMSAEQMQVRMDEIDKKLDADFNHLKLIDSRLSQSDLVDQAVLKAIHALLSHGISNNADGEMKKARDNLVNFIIDNK